MKKNTAKTLKTVLESKEKGFGEVKTKKKKKGDIITSSTQEYIPIKDIVNGVVITMDNRYIDIIEVIPTNFRKMDAKQKQQVCNAYAILFRSSIKKIHLKTIYDSSNPFPYIQNMHKELDGSDDEKLLQTADDVRQKALSLSSQEGAVSTRYFIIHEYEGDLNTTKEENRAAITQHLMEERDNIISILKSARTSVKSWGKNPNDEIASVYYYFYNRLTSQRESYDDRKKRISLDIAQYNEMTGSSKEPTYRDFVAPKGINFTSRNYLYMDGVYYSFLSINTESYPGHVEGGWLDVFKAESAVDIDVIVERQPEHISRILTQQYANINKGGSRFDFVRKAKELARYNALNVSASLNSGNKLYSTTVILTLKAPTKDVMDSLLRRYKKVFKNQRIKLDDCFLHVEDYFKLTMPFTYTNSCFRRSAHDITSDCLGSFYNYSAFEIFDDKGVLLGTNKDNNTLFAPNPFNNAMFANANITLVGTSGAGKTFTELLMGSRMITNGFRCFYILPKKGYEYINGVENCGGTYVKLGPGSNGCINVMEIRPEGSFDESQLGDDISVNSVKSGNVLNKKVSSLLMWVQLCTSSKKLSDEERSDLAELIYKVYAEKGILPGDDSSIYADTEKKILKEMPVLGDLYYKMIEIPSLQKLAKSLAIFVTGSLSSLNQQTTVDLKKRMVAIDCDEDDIGEDLLAAVLDIAFTFVYDEAKQNLLSKDIIFFDEAWEIMATEEMSKKIENTVRLFRGYGGGTVIATQNLQDFINAPGGCGKTILNLSSMQIFLTLNDEEANAAQQNLNLTDDDIQKIIAYRHGDALVKTNRIKTEVYIDATLREKEAFSTDIDSRIKKYSKS